VPLITDDLEQCEEEPVNDTQQSSLNPVVTQPEQPEDPASERRGDSVAGSKNEWATSIAARVMSAENKSDWATSTAARVLSLPESPETQDRPQSSLELPPASRVVSIAGGKSFMSYHRVMANSLQTNHSLSLDLQVLVTYRLAGPGLPSRCATVHCHHCQSRSIVAWRLSTRTSQKHSHLCIPLSRQQDNRQRSNLNSRRFEHLWHRLLPRTDSQL
jgi:hypothetical protein